MQPPGPGAPAAPMYGAPVDLLPADPPEFQEARDLLRKTDRLTAVVAVGWLVAGALLVPYQVVAAFVLMLVGGVALVFFFLGVPRFLPMVDDGRFEDTKRELLPYALLGFAAGVLPGVLLLVVRGKMTPLIVWQKQVLAATGAGPGGPAYPMYPPPAGGGPGPLAAAPPYGMPSPTPPPMLDPLPPPSTSSRPPSASYVPPPTPPPAAATPPPPSTPAAPPSPPAETSPSFAPAYAPPAASSPRPSAPPPSPPPSGVPRPATPPPTGEFATYTLPTSAGGGPRSGVPSAPVPPPPSGVLPTPGHGGFARVSATGPPNCKTCGKPTVFVPAYSRYYCYACAQYA